MYVYICVVEFNFLAAQLMQTIWGKLLTNSQSTKRFVKSVSKGARRHFLPVVRSLREVPESRAEIPRIWRVLPSADFRMRHSRARYEVRLHAIWCTASNQGPEEMIWCYDVMWYYSYTSNSWGWGNVRFSFGLVLGCTEADFCKEISILRHLFYISIRFAYFCTALK